MFKGESVEELFEAVREEASPALWSQGVKLSRSGKLVARWTGADEVELRITKPSGISSPVITVSPKYGDWSCECPSTESVCPHVVAAIVMARNAQKEGRDVLASQQPKGRIAFELSRIDSNVKGGSGLGLRLMVVMQDGSRMPWERPFALLERDQKAMDLLITDADRKAAKVEGARRRGPILRPVMTDILEALRECDDVTLDGKPVKIGEPRAIVKAVIETRRGGGVKVSAKTSDALERVFENGAALDDGLLFAVEGTKLSKAELATLHAGQEYPPDEMHAFMTTVYPELKKRIPVDVRTRSLPKFVDEAPRVLFQTKVDRGNVIVVPSIVYGEPPYARVDGEKLTFLGGKKVPIRKERAEAQLGNRLRNEMHMQPGRAVRLAAREALTLSEKIEGFGATVDGPGLDQVFVTSQLTPNLASTPEASSAPADGFPRLEDTVELTFRTEHEGKEVVVDAAAVVEAWTRNEDLVVLPDGGFAPLPRGFLEQHGQLLLDLVQARSGEKSFPRSAGADLAELFEALNHPLPPDFATLRKLADGFDELEEHPLPDSVTATLRPYQRSGVNWLGFLSRAHVGGLLADDMGLGKTLQAICVLSAPTLVVCPRSVLENWRTEIQRFRPGLTTALYHGGERSLDRGVDVTLTTYALLRRDIDLLSEVEWNTVVLDESQYIKNPKSQVAQAAYKLNAKTRIALTGTPVENRLEDLWSQMHFLNEGLLGGLNDFTNRYANPIAQGDEQMTLRLRRRVRPFILRRTKRGVASDLPPRTDVALWCELSDEERSVYDAIMAATRKDVVAQLEAGGSVLAALEALLRLRQACCHRALLPNQEAPSSSKIETLLESLTQALEEGHNALIFSQWTSMLDLVEPHLKKESIDFVRLDGSTTNRQEIVETFQRDEGPPVMLLSLKAGGTGLTLTRADHVFLLDPWWNPAVEDQAADRTHRIGQQRPVLVHRLVATNTVEERLLALQEKKRALAEAAIGDTLTGQGSGGSLSREDLLELLR